MSKFDYENYISPCRDKCRLDVDKKFCIGCYRTKDELKAWKHLSKEEKLVIMKIIPERQKRGYPFDIDVV
ncbi:MAG: DUF1289 domain-containing protein [Bacteroidota bacterium]|nr:DUF1289 domain-containing protein [Bacteroidota bacterium]